MQLLLAASLEIVRSGTLITKLHAAQTFVAHMTKFLNWNFVSDSIARYPKSAVGSQTGCNCTVILIIQFSWRDTIALGLHFRCWKKTEGNANLSSSLLKHLQLGMIRDHQVQFSKHKIKFLFFCFPGSPWASWKLDIKFMENSHVQVMGMDNCKCNFIRNKLHCRSFKLDSTWFDISQFVTCNKFNIIFVFFGF